MWLNGTRTLTQTFDAANQVNGWSYDNAGNLVSDGSATYGYDALNRMTLRGGTAYAYNGDGALVDDGTTQYTQDLASPLSQVLQTAQGSTTTNSVYGLDRLASVAGGTRTWYGYDALGSVRQTLDDTGTPLGVVSYDPWGAVETGTVPRFGFTGEVQDAASGLVNLSARWYDPNHGTFLNRDSFSGWAEAPASQHPYAYTHNNPVNNTDPSGNFCLGWTVGWLSGDHSCAPIWYNGWHADWEHTAEEGIPAYTAGLVMTWGAPGALTMDAAAGTHGLSDIVQQGLRSPTTGAGMITGAIIEAELLPYAAAWHETLMATSAMYVTVVGWGGVGLALGTGAGLVYRAAHGDAQAQAFALACLYDLRRWWGMAGDGMETGR